MKYRKFEKLGIEVSTLGIGAFRLPVNGDTVESINEKAATEMLSYAFDNGINYVDTAYTYHAGSSETFVGKVLKNGYRDKVFLATKSPTWLVESPEDLDRFLNEQLMKLQVEQIDFYLLHNLHSSEWEKMKSFHALEWGQKAVADGRIKYFGFSIHDTYDVFKDIIDAYDWDCCQIQYNYMNENVQVGTKGLKYAGTRNIPVIIMEPLLGGTLASLPEPIQKIWEKSAKLDPVELALKWLWNKPEVSCVLSGMSTLEQVKQNIKIADSCKINCVTKEDLELISEIASAFKKINPIPCTKCKYCIPCQVGIDIPRLLDMYNTSRLSSFQEAINKEIYEVNFPKNKNASACTSCKQCEYKCPQGIKISKWMKKIHKAFS